jgi:hypothetical protein
VSIPSVGSDTNVRFAIAVDGSFSTAGLLASLESLRNPREMREAVHVSPCGARGERKLLPQRAVTDRLRANGHARGHRPAPGFGGRMTKAVRIVASVAVACALLAPARSIHAQQGTGDIRGQVVDAQGGALPGVTVIARHQQSGLFRETLTAADGRFFIAAITPGLYEIEATMPGFNRFIQRDVQVEVGQTRAVEVTMTVGQMEESVTVTASAALIDTTSKEIGGNVSAQELADLPTMNRNFTSYLGLLPGVVSRINPASFGADDISANGQANANVSYTLDGSNNNEALRGGNGGAQARIAVESVQEFQLLTSQFDAEYGGSSGAIVNAVSKQGTNQFRGSLFYFFQDASMTALEYFAKQQGLEKAPTNQHQYGGTIGGPIVRNKAHFFGSFEGIRLDSGLTINIPARPEFNRADFERARIRNTMVRFDHQVTGNHTWGVRWLREQSPQYNQLSTNVTPSVVGQENDVDQTWVGNLNSVFKGTVVNSLKVSVTRENVYFANPQFFANGRRQDLLPPLLDYQTFLDGQDPGAMHQLERAWAVENILSSFISGRGGTHQLKGGVQITRMSADINDQDNMNGTFVFSHDLPFDPADPRTWPERFSIRVPGVRTYGVSGTLYGVFLQDKWQPTSRLTIDLGVRYDLEVIPIRNADNPRFASPDSYAVDKDNISPRLGFSYALGGRSESVIRGGFGLFYQRTPFGFLDDVVHSGVYSDSFTATFPATNADPGPSRGEFPTDPFLATFPNVNRALLEEMFPPGTTQKNTGAVTFDTPDRELPMTRQYSLGYSRQFGANYSVSVDLIRSEQRGTLMRLDLNPGLRESESRTAPLIRINPEFVSNVFEIGNYGWIDYTALQLQVQRRYASGFSVRGAYTYSKGWGNTATGQNDTMENQLLLDPRLELNEGPTNMDRPHILSVSATYDLPWIEGARLAAIIQARSGTPFTLTDSSFDLDRNGSFANEYLSAGTYSGVGPNAITVYNRGGRNGARGPMVATVGLRGGYRFLLQGHRTLDINVDVFNLFNRANFLNPSGDIRTPSTFLVLRATDQSAGPRSVQLNFRYGF